MTDNEPIPDPEPDDATGPGSLTTTVFSLDQARLVANVLIAIGGILLVAWAWTLVRGQQNAGYPFGFGGDGPELTFAQRLDIATLSLEYLAYAALALGAGIVVQLMTTLAEGRETT